MGVKKLDLKDSNRGAKILSVYGYTCYRTYLSDFYAFRKDSSFGYSYRAFSKSAGFSSPNILKLVIDGARNISPEATQKFIKALNIKNQMADYFETLVRMNQSQSDVDKEYYLTILRKLTPQSKRRELNIESLKYLSDWLFPVIREMVNLNEFRDDPYWISRRLCDKATPQEINAAIQFLKKEGFLVKGSDGTWNATDNMVISSDEIKNLAIRKFHRQMLAQANTALDNTEISEREFGALTFVLPEEAIEELKYKLKQFRTDLHTWSMQVAEDAGGELVVQMNFQMFPHTKKVTS
jgi:uncharacterized protein (TIGR02147 family)